MVLLPRSNVIKVTGFSIRLPKTYFFANPGILFDSDSNNLDELLASESDETIDYSRSLISHILSGITEITG